MTARLNLAVQSNLGNLSDPTLSTDAATKNYVDTRPSSSGAIIGTNDPSPTTTGVVGQLYYNSTTSNLFICTAITPNFVWNATETILSGSTAPSTSTVGFLGQMFIVQTGTSPNIIYTFYICVNSASPYTWVALTSGSTNNYPMSGATNVLLESYNTGSLTSAQYSVATNLRRRVYALPSASSTDAYTPNSGRGYIADTQYIAGNPVLNTNYGYGVRFLQTMQWNRTAILFNLYVSTLSFTLVTANQVSNYNSINAWNILFMMSKPSTVINNLLDPTDGGNAITFFSSQNSDNSFLTTNVPSFTCIQTSVAGGFQYSFTIIDLIMSCSDNFNPIDFVGSTDDYALFMVINSATVTNTVSSTLDLINTSWDLQMQITLQNPAGTGGGGTSSYPAVVSPQSTLAIGGSATNSVSLDIAQQGATNNQVLAWNGTKYAPYTIPAAISPTYLAYRKVSFLASYSVDTIIQWDTLVSNNTNLSVAANGVITYTGTRSLQAVCSAMIGFANDSAGTRVAYCTKNGISTLNTSRVAQSIVTPVNGDGTFIMLTFTTSLATNDVLRFYVYQTSVNTTTTGLTVGGAVGGIASGYSCMLNITCF